MDDVGAGRLPRSRLPLQVRGAAGLSICETHYGENHPANWRLRELPRAMLVPADAASVELNLSLARNGPLSSESTAPPPENTSGLLK